MLEKKADSIEDTVDEDRSYCVYMHTNKVNGKRYVGQTCQWPPEKRWRKDGVGYRHNEYFYRSIQKYGWDNFEHEIIDARLTIEEANELEEHLIENFDTLNRSKGYNLRHGGNNGEHSEETKTKLKRAWEHRDRVMPEHVRKAMSKSRTGKHLSEETKKKISKAQKGKPRYYIRGENHPNYGKHYSEEERKQMSERMSGKNNPNYGKHFSEEHKRKISESNKGKYVPSGAENPTADKVAQYNMDGVLIKVWGCKKDAARTLNINPSHISACCKGRRKSAGEYMWTDVIDGIVQNNIEPYNKAKRNIPIVQLSKDLNIIAEYKNARMVSDLLNIPLENVYACVRGYKESVNGITLKYKKDIEQQNNN